jgi:transcriptional regulator with XRE-family HTH domain
VTIDGTTGDGRQSMRSPKSMGEHQTARKLREARNARGLTLQQVGQRCDPPTTSSQIWKLETGRRQLKTEWVGKLARALQCEQCEITDELTMMVSLEERAMLVKWRSLPATQRDAIMETINNLIKPL